MAFWALHFVHECDIWQCMLDEFVSTEFLAARLRVDPQTVRRWARNNWRREADGLPMPGVLSVHRDQIGLYRYQITDDLRRDDVVVLTLAEAEARLDMDRRSIFRRFSEGGLQSEIVAIYHFHRFVRVLVPGKATTPEPRPKVRGVDWEWVPLGRMSDRKIAKQLGVSAATVARARSAAGIAPCGRPGRPRVAR